MPHIYLTASSRLYVYARAPEGRTQLARLGGRHRKDRPEGGPWFRVRLRTLQPAAPYLSPPRTNTASRLMVVPVAAVLLVPVQVKVTQWSPGVSQPLDQTVCL